MEIVYNGQPRDVAAAITVADLLAETGLNVQHVAVEVNQELVPRARQASHSLAAGDCVEVVTLVGGG